MDEFHTFAYDKESFCIGLSASLKRSVRYSSYPLQDWGWGMTYGSRKWEMRSMIAPGRWQPHGTHPNNHNCNILAHYYGHIWLGQVLGKETAQVHAGINCVQLGSQWSFICLKPPSSVEIYGRDQKYRIRKIMYYTDSLHCIHSGWGFGDKWRIPDGNFPDCKDLWLVQFNKIRVLTEWSALPNS